jgi:hypothetical protein
MVVFQFSQHRNLQANKVIPTGMIFQQNNTGPETAANSYLYYYHVSMCHVHLAGDEI